MFKFPKISLSAAPFYASLLVILALAIFIGIFWAINEYQAYQESIENINHNYQEQYKERVREELENVIDYIDFTRHQTTIAAEQELRDRVQSAHTIASHLYSMYRDERNVGAIEDMVSEVLRPVRWYEGRGYYFAGRIDTGTIALFSDDPYFEDKKHFHSSNKGGTDAIADMVSIARDKGAGLYRFNLVKPAFPDRVFSQISFVKYFPPFDWYIGAGIYSDDMENHNQAATLARIKNIQFGEGGEVSVFRVDGTIISHKNEQLIGRSITNLKNERNDYGSAIWEISRDQDGEGFVTFLEKSEDSAPFRRKLCFVKSYDDWGWVIVTSMYMNKMEELIQNATETYRRIAFKNVSTFIILFTLAVSLLLLSAYFYTIKIKQGFSLFTDFFRQAADSQLKIKEEDLPFRELEDLAHLANLMVDDRIQKENLLHRDELRLDTLLRLGMMENFSLKDKYNFTLQRIIQIARSEEGYLALVNKKQQHVTIISHYKADGTRVAYPNKRDLSRNIYNGGLPGQAVIRKNAAIRNEVSQQPYIPYPYRHEVDRHLDVPIFNSGAIVLVAGVCNNHSNYDNSDIRQMTMILEGMWLHVLKTRSEKKMARLEREIIAVREAERSSIGRILHDDLGSHLSGVELLSKALQRSLEKDNPKKAEQMESIRGLIVDATEKTRRLARGLYPVHIIENGLEAAVEELAVEIEKLFGLACDLSFHGKIDFLDNNVASHLYYIIREASFNAARHGNPESISITVHTEFNNLMVKIMDDGSGFNVLFTKKGMGLHTMEYRAKAIGAVLSLQSDPQIGTVISVTRETKKQ